jgi:uncharacterized protein YjlB
MALTPEEHLYPASPHPLLIYRKAFYDREIKGAEWLENHFAQNNWTSSWRAGVYDYHHFHSTAHEVLGVYQGEAVLQLGGEAGDLVDVKAGDIIVIPAGVSHKAYQHSKDFKVVGAYAEGHDWDIKKRADEEAQANMKKLPLPAKDPFTGKRIWN